MWTEEQVKRVDNHLRRVRDEINAAPDGSMAQAMASLTGAMTSQSIMAQVEFEIRQTEAAEAKNQESSTNKEEISAKEYPDIVQKLLTDLHNELPKGPICESVWMGRMEAISKKWPPIILKALLHAREVSPTDLLLDPQKPEDAPRSTNDHK